MISHKSTQKYLVFSVDIELDAQMEDLQKSEIEE